LRERRTLWKQKSMERELFERAAVAFQKTGVLKKPPGISTMGSFDELLEHQVETDTIDMNPQVGPPSTFICVCVCMCLCFCVFINTCVFVCLLIHLS
jgi:hypothetical protein